MTIRVFYELTENQQQKLEEMSKLVNMSVSKVLENIIQVNYNNIIREFGNDGSKE